MDEKQKRIIKKYPNRRLYDTATSCYITLEDVKQLVLEKIDIQVLDAKTSEDLTLTTLLQIVLEAESLGQPIFTYEALTQIIRFYGNAMQGMMGTHLEKNLSMFTQLQQQLLEQGQAMHGKQFTMNTAPWDAFIATQMPLIQSTMNTYIEQSAHLFATLQNHWQDQAKNVFKGFPFSTFINPFMPTPHTAKDESSSSSSASKKE